MQKLPRQEYVPLAPRLREQMLRVIDSDPSIIPIMHWVYVNQVRRGTDILKWIADHGFTGVKFKDFFAQQCESSPFEMIAFVTRQLEKQERPLYAGRDFIEI